MTEYLTIPNWSKFQHYGKRNPPWIKVYNELLDDIHFSDDLTDAEKGQLVCLWMLAARCDNKIPYSASFIKRKTGLASINIDKLLQGKWLMLASGASVSRAEESRDRAETEESRKECEHFTPEPKPIKDPLDNMPTLQALHTELRKHISDTHQRVKQPKPGTKDYLNERATLSQLVRLDHFSEAEVVEVIRWVFTDGGKDATFWKQQVQSITGLRKKCGDGGLNKFARLEEAMLRDGGQVEDISMSGGNPFAGGKGTVD